MNKREGDIVQLMKDRKGDTWRLYELFGRGHKGPPSKSKRDYVIYLMYSIARLLSQPKHPGLAPVPLSQEKARNVVGQWLSGKTEVAAFSTTDQRIVEMVKNFLDKLRRTFDIPVVIMSDGSIRAACTNGKKVSEDVSRINDRTARMSALLKKPAKKRVKSIPVMPTKEYQPLLSWPPRPAVLKKPAKNSAKSPA